MRFSGGKASSIIRRLVKKRIRTNEKSAGEGGERLEPGDFGVGDISIFSQQQIIILLEQDGVIVAFFQLGHTLLVFGGVEYRIIITDEI
jgi:hypothetical protein